MLRPLLIVAIAATLATCDRGAGPMLCDDPAPQACQLPFAGQAA